MQKQIAIITIAALAASLSMLAGCSAGAHEIIDSTEACISCHAEKQTYANATPANATACASEITVSTSADRITVCKPTFTKEDGSYYVPVLAKTAAVTDGAATVQLDEGYWVICIADGNTAKSSVLVHVSNAADSATEISL